MALLSNIITPTGLVTSVAATSPIVSSGGTTPAISLATTYGDTLNPYASKTANYILAAPNGTAGVPTFRALVAADIPTLNQNTTGTAAGLSSILTVASGGTGTATPALVAGTNVTISGTWPNQTINASGATSTYTRTAFTATAGQTVFSVAYTVGYVEVYYNGILQPTDEYTATNGTSITLAVAASLNDLIEVIAYSISSIAPVSNIQSQIFTSTTTWTAPAGVTKVRLLVVGGGGGGGGEGVLGCCTIGDTGSAGGRGGLGWGVYTVTPGITYTVTVGAGGNGSTTTTGGAGGESWFGINSSTKLLNATGGLGGVTNSAGSGTDGTSTLGNLRNTTAVNFPTMGGGSSIRATAASSTAALAWSISSIYSAGACGSGETGGSNNTSGGIGGLIFLEYVG